MEFLNWGKQKMTKYFQYFVEGECERKLINELKGSNMILPGKVEVFNVLRDKISKQRLLVLKPKTNIILIYDIDVEKTEILKYNIDFLKKHNFKKIYHIQSLNNFEDELVFATSLKSINDMYHTASVDEFKTKFLHQNNLLAKLKNIHYTNCKMWSRVNKKEPFSVYSKEEDLNIIKKLKV